MAGAWSGDIVHKQPRIVNENEKKILYRSINVNIYELHLPIIKYRNG